jgi:uncharacterized protein (TIGR02996 family)
MSREADRVAFLRRICRDSADDYPRMVYADYLDECGEGARAELIRVQCELQHTTQFDQKNPRQRRGLYR